MRQCDGHPKTGLYYEFEMEGVERYTRDRYICDIIMPQGNIILYSGAVLAMLASNIACRILLALHAWQVLRAFSYNVDGSL